MADYYPVLKRAISSLPSGSGESRRAVYEKARVALLRQLSSYNPPLSPTDIADQRVALEDCIRRVEAEVAGVSGEAGAGTEVHAPAVAKAEPPAPERIAQRAAPRPAAPRREEPTVPERKGGLASLAAPDMNPFRHIDPLPARGAPVRVDPPDWNTPRPPASLPTERPRLPTARLPDEHGEPRIGVGVSALSRTLKQADTLGEASSSAVRAARYAMNEVDEVDDPVSTERIEPDLGDARQAGSRSEATTVGAPDKSEPERSQFQREAATLPWPEENTGAGRRGRLLLIGLAVIVVIALGSAVFAFRGTLSALVAGEPETETAAATSGDGLAPKILDRLPAEGEAPAVPVAPDAVSVQTEAVAAPAVVDPDLPPAPGGATAVDPATPIAPTGTPPPAETGPAVIAQAAPTTPPAATATGQTIGVAQKAILYEEPIPGSPGTKLDGSVVWSFVNEPTLPGDKPVPQIRGDVEVPELGLKMRLSIHKNDDQALPASHIVEFSFNVPPSFAGKFIDAAPGMIAKQTEEARGDTITGAVAKVSDSLFWLALSGLEQDVTRNVQLLKQRPWIDVPIRYGNRRRAILTFEKGAPGDKAFADAFAAWGE